MKMFDPWVFTRTRKALAAASVTALAVGLAGTTANAESVTLRGAHIYPENYIQSGVNFEKWAERVEERSNGEIQIEIVHGGALLGVEDHVDGIQAGLVDLVSFYPIYFPGEFRVEGALTNIIDIWSEETPDLAGIALIHSQLHEEFEVFKQEYDDRNMRMLLPLPVDPYIIVCGEPIESVADLEGKKMRTFGRYLPILQEHLGVDPITVPGSEAYTALATGLIDCVYSTPDWIHSNGLHEVAPHLFIPAPDQARPQLFATAVVAMNTNSYDRLSPEHQKIIDEVSREMLPVVGEMMEGVYKQGIDNLLKDGGGTINHMSEEDFEAWKERTPELLDLAAEHLEDAGYPGEEIMDRYRELAADYVAGEWPSQQN